MPGRLDAERDDKGMRARLSGIGGHLSTVLRPDIHNELRHGLPPRHDA